MTTVTVIGDGFMGARGPLVGAPIMMAFIDKVELNETIEVRIEPSATSGWA